MRFLLYLAIVLTVMVPATVAGQEPDPALARADSLWQSGQRTACLDLLKSTADQARTVQDSSRETRALTRLGARTIALGQPGQAADYLRRAAELADAQSDTQALLPAVRWYSLSSGLRGRTAEADSLYQLLFVTSRAAGDSLHMGWARVGQASRHLDLGQPERATRSYQQAVSFFLAAGEIGGELWARNGLGIALNRGGEFRQALEVYTEVAARAHELGNLMTEANATNNVGYQQMLMGDPGAAQQAFSLAVALSDSLGMPGLRQTPALNLALCELELGNPDTAEAILDSNLALARRHQLTDTLGPLLIEKGRLALSRGRDHAATVQFEAALALGDTLSQQNRARTVVLLTNVATRSGQSGEAENILDRYARDLPARGLGTASWELSHARARVLLEQEKPEEALSLLQDLDPRFKGTGIDRHFIAQKRLLSRTLLKLNRPHEAIAQLRLAAEAWQQQREKPGEFRWREVRAASGREVFLELARLLYQFPEKDASAPGDLDAIFRLLQGYKSRTLLERTAGHVFADSLMQRLGNTTGLKEFQAQLPDRSVILDWYAGPEFSLLLAVTPDQARLVFLPDERNLLQRAGLFREMLQITDPSDSLSVQSLATASRSLATALLGPVENLLLEADSITSCPDGPLHRLPLEAMVQLTGYFDQELSATWQLTPSLAFLLLQGDPAKDSQADVFVVAGSKGLQGQDLPGPARELADLKSHYSGVLGRLLKNEEELDWSEISTPSVLHLASHVLVDHQTPWQSALDFSVTGPDGRTGKLTAERILGLKLSNQLTVLNGCGTASGKTLAGEGVQSLTAAFLAAGSDCVVATLWPVADSTARLFTSAFYENLATGLTVSQAVHEARLWLRQQPGTSSPLQWGAYVVYGNGAAKISLEPRAGPVWQAGPGILTGGLLALAGLLVGWAIHAQRNKQAR